MALREVANPTRAQRGCVEFVLIRPKDDLVTLIRNERWASEADHQLHLQGSHAIKPMSSLGNILAVPPKIVAYDIIDE